MMKMKRYLTVWVAFVVAVGLTGVVVPAFADGVAAGQKAADFTLEDSSGEEHSLADYKNKVVVLEWTNYLCPFVRKHYDTGNMQALQKEYTGKGVIWLTVNSSAPGKQGHFSSETWQTEIDKCDAASTAVLLDPDGEVGRAYGAKVTPHLFVIDTRGILVYKGAIDDKATVQHDDVNTAENYVKPVVDALLADETVEPKETRPYGCGVKY